MRTGFRLSALIGIPLLSASGKPLGTYQVRDVKLVPGSSLDKLEPYGRGGPELLRIQFAAKTDLEAASNGHDLYVHGDFCPLKNEYQLGIFGPYYGDQPRLLSRRVTSYKKSADGRVTMSVESKNRHPPRDATGEYIYTAYLAPSLPKEQFSPPYDLHGQARDLCLRIDSPGYYVIPSRSKIFTIRAAVIQRALGTPKLPR